MIRSRVQFLVWILVATLLACTGGRTGLERLTAGTPGDTLDVALLGGGMDIRESGELLMQLPPGLNRIINGGNESDTLLVVLLHGYRSQGYEWVTAVQDLTERYGVCQFYRYDWEQCPGVVAASLNESLRTYLKQHRSVRNLLLFSHSYGGVIGAQLAGLWDSRIPLELHIIAAPLAGFPNLFDPCTDLRYDEQDRLIYPPWRENVHVIQHKTVHAQDGAFRDLAVDPQEIDLPFEEVILLPPTMDGHRLGHNWSVSWVVDEYLGEHHGF